MRAATQAINTTILVVDHGSRAKDALVKATFIMTIIIQFCICL